jgi:hypothetical protein
MYFLLYKFNIYENEMMNIIRYYKKHTFNYRKNNRIDNIIYKI